jgi:heme exporter protein A
MTNALTLSGKGLGKSFNGRAVFHDVSFSVEEHQTLLITGHNGSGKSTLMKIICQVLTPSAGHVEVGRADSAGDGGRDLFGFVSPYLQMFEEFSAMENLAVAMGIRGRQWNKGEAAALLERVGLDPDRDEPVRTYSSGMKQRVKYAFALLHHPPVLLLDEPAANLDAEGVSAVRSIMAAQRKVGILVVATNDPGDVDTHDVMVDLDARR